MGEEGEEGEEGRGVSYGILPPPPIVAVLARET